MIFSTPDIEYEIATDILNAPGIYPLLDCDVFSNELVTCIMLMVQMPID